MNAATMSQRPSPLLEGELLFLDSAGIVVRSIRVRVPNSPRGRRLFLAEYEDAERRVKDDGLTVVPLPPPEFGDE